MIKHISFAYMLSSMGVANIPASEFCEIKDIQSPYVKSIDNPTVDPVQYNPVIRCQLANTNESERNAALLHCISVPKQWLKI